jgi:DME family drug/metabolite transporter
MLPLNVIGGTIGPAIAAAVCTISGVGLDIPLYDLLWSLAMGVFQLGLALILFTSGSRFVPAADISLLALTEVVPAPLWGWFVLGETVGLFTLLGGALVLMS